jgi:hypothetical protein
MKVKEDIMIEGCPTVNMNKSRMANTLLVAPLCWIQMTGTAIASPNKSSSTVRSTSLTVPYRGCFNLMCTSQIFGERHEEGELAPLFAGSR